MDKDSYNIVRSHTTATYKDKGSKFIAYLFPVINEIEIKIKIAEIKKIEHSARHYCYAYVLKTEKTSFRASDDGEPSSSAGKPILGQINSNNLTNIIIIVVRYFGGVKLGIPGLIRAYKSAAAMAISKTDIIIKEGKENFEVSFSYSEINSVMRLVKKLNLEVLKTDFQIQCKLIFAVQRRNANKTQINFKKHHKLSIKKI